MPSALVSAPVCDAHIHAVRSRRVVRALALGAIDARRASMRYSLRSFSSFSFSSLSSSRIDSRVIRRRRYPRTGYPKRAARPRFEKKSHRRSSKRW